MSYNYGPKFDTSTNYNYGPKFDFTSLKVGDTVVCTSHSWSFNGRDTWPNENEFVFTTVKDIRDGIVTVDEGYKFKQDREINYGETEFFNRLKLTRKNAEDRYPFNNTVYNFEYPLCEDRTTLGVSAPLYLFPYEDRWTKKVEEYNEKREALFVEEKKWEAKEEHRKTLLHTVYEAVREEQDAVDKANKALQDKWTEVYHANVCPHCKDYECPFYCGEDKNYVCDKDVKL